MSEKKPFNDVSEHFTKIEGYPIDPNLKTLPKPLRFIGYFIIGFFSISTLAIIILSILK